MKALRGEVFFIQELELFFDRTTKDFLRAFHLSSLEELPEMPGVETDGQLRLGDDGTVIAPDEPSLPLEDGQPSPVQMETETPKTEA